MAPSAESKALEELFKVIAANFPQDGNAFLGRCVYDQVHRAGSEAEGVSLQNRTISANGLDVPCIWFVPRSASTSPHHSQVVLYMHGGGFNFGSPNGHRKLTAHLAKACQCPALSVDYRLTPENKYPAALDDCLAAYQWLLDANYKPENIIVAGDSCGGSLSASVPLACIQRGLPVPGASISLSPSYDLTTREGGTMESNEQNDVLNTKPFMGRLAENYVEGSGARYDDPLISPLLTKDEDLAKFPPHWISIAGYDMLRDQGERMAARLKKNGVEVVAEVHEGQQHVMEFMVGKAPEATESIRRIGEWVRGKLATS